jgi:hypothetical protein
MKVCGFSFVRNAIKFGYPVVESVNSVLPVCDHFVIIVGNSDDGTLDLIRSINSSKIQIIESVWDESLRNGEVLAVETNKAMDSIAQDFDWCFYIQADEVVHEKFLPTILDAMKLWKDNPDIEGLLLKYIHFWGNYDYIATSRQWYRREIRIIKNDKKIRSYRDAQGFRKNGKKLKVKLVDAFIYHYGWVKNPSVMFQKAKHMGTLWHGDDYELIKKNDMIDYSETDAVSKFKDTHPSVMENRISSLNWHVDLEKAKFKTSLKNRLLSFYENVTGHRLFEYENYKIV